MSDKITINIYFLGKQFKKILYSPFFEPLKATAAIVAWLVK